MLQMMLLVYERAYSTCALSSSFMRLLGIWVYRLRSRLQHTSSIAVLFTRCRSVGHAYRWLSRGYVYDAIPTFLTPSDRSRRYGLYGVLRMRGNMLGTEHICSHGGGPQPHRLWVRPVQRRSWVNIFHNQGTQMWAWQARTLRIRR